MIQKKITKIDAAPRLERLINVAAYARVSSGKDAMLHSLAAQITYYQNLIASHQGWKFAGVYADEAFTGTKDNRHEFQRLIQDCKDGKIDMVIVKAISRFARNTVTLLKTVRMLKSINVDVYFEEQNLHTLSAEGEMVLTFLASFAQEESRSVSENMKWRIKKDFEKGLIWGSKTQLGYRIVDRRLVVVPEEAELVRRIFSLYLDGYGFQGIANLLNAEGQTSVLGNKWSKTAIEAIINNYNYTGDLVLQKTFRVDHLTKHKQMNRGEKTQYLVEDAHEPIITKEQYMMAQTLKKQRAQHFNLLDMTKQINLFTGIVWCGACGKHYRRKKQERRMWWTCSTFNTAGKGACNSKSVPEEVLIEITKKVLGVKEITAEIIKSKVDHIDVLKGNRLVFHLKNGSTIEETWKSLSRKDNWTPEMKEKARQRAIAQYRRKEGKHNG